MGGPARVPFRTDMLERYLDMTSMTRVELSRRLGYTSTFVTEALKDGRMSMPGLNQLATIMQVSVSDLTTMPEALEKMPDGVSDELKQIHSDLYKLNSTIEKLVAAQYLLADLYRKAWIEKEGGGE